MNSFSVVFHGDLRTLGCLRQEKNGLSSPGYRRASVKDVIEAMGVPHTEVGGIRIDGLFVNFQAIVQSGQVVDVYPVDTPWDVRQPSLLRPDPLPGIAFFVDENVHRLVGLLRMVGMDALGCRGMADVDIARESERQARILLSRDHRLLQRRRVVFGRLVRAHDPWEQLREVVRLFGLQTVLRPFSRCIHCNEMLEHRPKADIFHRLEPLTRRYYNTFFECPGCHRLYWPGSHQQRMQSHLAEYGLLG